jgi:hypothetical protein
MVSSKSVRNVLKLVLSGKEETPPDEKGIPKPMGAPVQRQRYYFYEALPQNSIQFTALQDVLKTDSPTRDATIKKLQSGNTGKYFADYFRWIKVAVVTNEYSPGGKDLVVYEADLTPIGKKIPGKEVVSPSDTGTTTETVEADLLLFSDKRAESQIINLDNSSESFYIDQAPPGNLAQVLRSRAIPPGRPMRFNEFERKFDEYRIYVPSLEQLLLPNFEVPKRDGVPGGHYVGGQRAYQQLVGPIEKQIEEKKEPEQPSLADKAQEKQVFEPVQKKTAPVKGQYLDNTSQGEKMAVDTRRVRNVILAYLKNAAYAATPPASSTTAPMGKKRPSIPVSDNPDENMMGAKTLQDLATQQKKMETQVQNLKKNITQRVQGIN